MADFTITRADRFPDGTDVDAYPTDGWNFVPAIGLGTAAATETAASGEVAFTGLEETPHFFVAEVDDEKRVVKGYPGQD
jgi:hypothetical protein